MRRKSHLLILATALLSFGTSACFLPLLNGGGGDQTTGKKMERKNGSKSKPTNKSKTNRSAGAPVALDVDKNTDYINVMGKEMPEMPEFDELEPEAGKVRGYVKDVDGNPLKGAHLGVRSTAIGGAYSGAQGQTDDEGYYEIQVPMGVAHFYNAGYAIDWGADGLAAIGLHPADGVLDSFASNVGGVENFVLLPYGVTSRENTSQSPHLASTYYGGSVYIHYYAAEASDNYAMAGSIVEGSVIEINLTPEGEPLMGVAPQTFTVRKTIGFRGGFYIHNLPLGQYRIAIKTADGEPLKMELNKPRNSEYGIKPTSTTDSALLTLAPSDARANMVTPQYGGWSAVELNITRP